MSKKFPTLDQALDIDKAEKERFNALKNDTFQALRSIPETWIFKLFEKKDLEKFHEYIEVISAIIIENIKNIDDMPPLEFMKNNISEILSENYKIEKQLESDYKNIENKHLSFDEFKKELEFPGNIFSEIYSEFEKEKEKNIEIIKLKLEMLYSSCLSFKKMKDSFDDYFKIYINKSISSVNNELESFRRLRNIADNARTENIYNTAVDKYRNLEENYRSYFYWGIGILLCLSVGLLTLKQDLVPYLFSTIEFWAVKVSLLLVGITLISYFLKQSAHYQRLADQNYQTQVELQAYPSFMESIPSEEAASVRKELALKYFGREIDGTAHKEMSNLISDQMKSTTEMVKATTEAIKNIKG
ncbi:hypothetical protein [Acinetobacter baumannii]|uniref:hypothetical protein n=1 Tax=Acinetobacter baumannii TaxID=470 RepID=UPI0034CDBC69